MVKSIIIDDEPHCCNTLSTLLKRHCPEIEVSGIFYSGADALAFIKIIMPQIIFLDIEMPHMNGFEFLEQITEINFEIIFTTSYDQYAIKAFHFSALDYLLKPIDREELQRAVQKVIHRQDHHLPEQIELLLKKMHQSATAFNKIALPTMEGLQIIPVNSVISCASDGNYTLFFLKNQKKLIVSRILKEIEQILEDHSFTRVHNSYIVNLNEIEKYIRGEGGFLVMSDGSSVNVSRSRKENLLKKLSPSQI